MKTIVESFTAKERAEMQEAADRIAEESQRLMWETEHDHLRAAVLTLIAIATMACVLSLLAEWIATF